jgi:hypothetical protein
VGNIFGEPQIFAFLHTLGHNRPFKWIGFVQSGGGIGAFEKAVDDLVFHRTVQAPCTAPLTGVPDHAPVEQARAPVVRAICTPWCATAPTSSVSFAARHSGSNAQQGGRSERVVVARDESGKPDVSAQQRRGGKRHLTG